MVIAILTVVRWYFIVDLICISWIISVVEHLFVHLFAICMGSLENCLPKSFSRFLFGYLFFCYWVCEFIVYFGFNPSLYMWFADIFSQSTGCIFNVLIISFEVQKFFSLMFIFILFIFTLIAFALVSNSKRQRQDWNYLCSVRHSIVWTRDREQFGEKMRFHGDRTLVRLQFIVIDSWCAGVLV